jgi:hypothetical protein
VQTFENMAHTAVGALVDGQGLASSGACVTADSVMALIQIFQDDSRNGDIVALRARLRNQAEAIDCNQIFKPP